MPPAPGRPRKASPELLQEAAFELFQLDGYRNTSVEQIAKTAGFSRATFFNFFASKADLYWLETDTLIGRLREALEVELGRREVSARGSAPLREVLLEFSSALSSANIPWALQNFRLLEAADDLIASGAGRVLELNRMFQAYLQRSGQQPDPLARSGEAAVLTALLITAVLGWIDAGVGRGSFRAHLERAFAHA